MLFDVNTAIGHWPFRKLQDNDAPSLRKLLESHKITMAAVANINGIFYKNTQDANLELAEALAPHRDFFTGIATLNPAYAAWERDLEYCVRTLGLKGLRLLPQYHNYPVFSPEAVNIAAAAAQFDIPILIPQMIVDKRQKHWLDVETYVDVHELGRLCRKVPQAKFILTEYRIPANLIDESGKPLYPNLYIEISRLRSAYMQDLAKLAQALGSDHLLFGSGAPFKEISPAILKMQCADLSGQEKAQINGLNAHSLFSL
ncbi:MAG: amidohydrolase family protein [Victivallaceae bacterium]|jgi:hypothetical protein